MLTRQDVGGLWENFLIAERRKKVTCQRLYGNAYYWRTYNGAELDYVEERDGRLHGYEFKWKKGSIRPPITWQTDYADADFAGINRDNYLDFVV